MVVSDGSIRFDLKQVCRFDFYFISKNTDESLSLYFMRDGIGRTKSIYLRGLFGVFEFSKSDTGI
jgi:hypothetical protein